MLALIITSLILLIFLESTISTVQLRLQLTMHFPFNYAHVQAVLILFAITSEKAQFGDFLK